MLSCLVQLEAVVTDLACACNAHVAHRLLSQPPVATLTLQQFCRDEITPYMH